MSLAFTLFDTRLASLHLQQVILLFLWRVSEPHFLRPSQTSKYYELYKQYSSQDSTFFFLNLQHLMPHQLLARTFQGILERTGLSAEQVLAVPSTLFLLAFLG